MSSRVERVMVIAVLALIGACSDPGHEAGGQVTGPAPGNSPSQTGAISYAAWGPQIKEAAARSRSDLERTILADGVITPAELAEAKNAFATCLQAQRVTVIWNADDDGFSLGYPINAAPAPDEIDRMKSQQAECTTKTPMNAVTLYYQIRRNPQKLDEYTIIAECLVRRGVMPKGYGAADFERDRAAQPPPQQFASEGAGRCFANPLER